MNTEQTTERTDTNRPAAEEVFVNNGPSADDIAALDAIAAIAEEMQPQLEAEVEGGGAGGEQSAEEVAAAATADPAAPPTEGNEDRGLERVVAREVELRAQTEAFKAEKAAFETERTGLQNRVRELEGQVAAFPADFVRSVGVSPSKALRAAGHDPDQIVRLCIAEKLEAQGKPIPPQLAAEIAQHRTVHEQNSRVATLEQELRHYQQAQAAAAFVASVEAGARTYLNDNEGISKHAPEFASVAKANPTRAYQEIMDEISRDAAGKAAGKDPNAKILTYEEAARRVEARWKDTWSLRTPTPSDPNPAASTTTPAKPALKGATTGASAKTATPNATRVPAPITRKPVMNAGDDAFEQAIAEAVAEAQRVERAAAATR